MRINNNISAVITNKQLLGTEGSLAESMERLSSGLKINHAYDNPSGMAIAGKIRAQIQGLDQASRNSADGSSVLQIVDGALSEVTNMVQRMRELAVQAANGINEQDEKDSIQKEIASLRDEIGRISATTEFNTKSLLDGSLDARVYPSQDSLDLISRISVSDSVTEGVYAFTVDQAATQPELKLADSVNMLIGHDATFDLNGEKIEITADMTKEEVYEALRIGAEHADCTMEADMNADSEIVFRSNQYGAHAEVTLAYYSEDDAFNAAFGAGGIPNLKEDPEAEPVVDVGTNAVVTLGDGFGKNATVAYEGNRIKISDVNGFQMDLLLQAGYTSADPISLEVTDIGIMDLQVGANKGQTMQVRIPAMDAESLYLDTVNVSTVHGAKDALNRLDEVLDKVSSVRSQIGAYENRLDYTTTSLDETEENMTEALSRIEDVDMAEEMVEYTKDNVLEQAGTSALAQANELPELALQLLGNR